jgi:hypothetical protein
MVREAVDGKDTTHSTDDIGTRYRYIVAACLYVATMVRPDAALAIGLLTRCMAYPSEALLREAERVLIYLYHTRNLGLKYSKTLVNVVEMDLAPTRGPVTDGDADSNFENKRSTTGYMFMLLNTAITWCVRRQQSIALSTTEAELMLWPARSPHARQSTCVASSPSSDTSSRRQPSYAATTPAPSTWRTTLSNTPGPSTPTAATSTSASSSTSRQGRQDDLRQEC